MTCPTVTDLGPYVLGGLEPEEYADVRRHLDHCVQCRDALEEIAWIPASLDKLPTEEIERLIAQHRIRQTAGTTARRQRWLAAAAMVLAVIGATTAVAHVPGSMNAGSTVQTVDPHTRVTATLAMTPRGAKTGLRLKLAGVAPGERCSLISRTKAGRTEVTATWVASYRGTADIPATTAIPATQLSGFDIVTADDRVLARLAVPHR
jgi:hypothetical protein